MKATKCPIEKHIWQQARKAARKGEFGVFIGQRVRDLLRNVPEELKIQVVEKGKLADFLIIVSPPPEHKVLALSILDAAGNLHAIEYRGRQDGLYDGAWADVARGWVERYNHEHGLVRANKTRFHTWELN